MRNWIRVVGGPAAEQLAGAVVLAGLLAAQGAVAQSPVLTPGNLVVALEGCGVYGGTCSSVQGGTGDGTGNSSVGGYGDNQAGPLTLFQYAPVGTSSATFVNSLVLPQSASGANYPVAGEYGSSSEGSVQLSGNGLYLTVMGYGVNPTLFNASPASYGAVGTIALGQSGSLTGQSYTPVPRVVALIDAYGNVNSTTPVYNVFDTNNPRSVYTFDGTTAYISGQGNGSDATAGVFYLPLGAPNSVPTAITGLDTTSNTLSQDTRDMQIVNGTLYVSVDTKGGKNSARSYIGTLGTAGTPPTTLQGGPVMLTGYGNTGGTGKVTISGNGNNINAGLQINTSPVNFFFANASTLYVADSGNPKNDSANSTLGDGGLQKWINTKADGSGTWNLAYTLYNGLGLVSNKSASGVTGLFGLAGRVVGGAVQLYATSYTLLDTDVTYLYGITDTLSFATATQAAGEVFAVLDKAPMDSNFKGVSFAPVAKPIITWAAPAAVAFGSALSGEQLNATANVPGMFTYSPAAGTVPPVGSDQLSVTFTPSDATDYTTATATTSITVNAASQPASPVTLVVSRVLSRTGGNVVVQLTITDTGGTTATGVTVTSVKIGSATATPLPVAVGTVAAGGSATVTVNVPASVGASDAASTMTIAGTYNGGSFGSSARITLP